MGYPIVCYRTYNLEGALELASLTIKMNIKNGAGIEVARRLLVPGGFVDGQIIVLDQDVRVQNPDNRKFSDPPLPGSIDHRQLEKIVRSFEKEYQMGRYVDWQPVTVGSDFEMSVHPKIAAEVFDRRVFDESGQEIGHYVKTNSKDRKADQAHFEGQRPPSMDIIAMGTKPIRIGMHTYTGIFSEKGLAGYIRMEDARKAESRVYDAHGVIIGSRKKLVMNFPQKRGGQRPWDHLGSGRKELSDGTLVVPLYGDAREQEILGYVRPIPLVEKLTIPMPSKERERNRASREYVREPRARVAGWSARPRKGLT